MTTRRKFSVGDRVRYKDKIATITGRFEDGSYGIDYRENGMVVLGIDVPEDELELVEKEKP